ncbi:unnamed protein product [Rodentolepis nana]|uniref:Uncharacterized protein n=1 Tax=Rodentolepis nana TaxID=102285 RepID=A0A0R3TS75_RODNA|nr:unnamed protein product [Rodentolepis nana]
MAECKKNLNRIGLIFHREDLQPIGEGPIITAVAKIIPYRQISIDILPFLQNVDKALRFLPPLFQAAKACLIIFGFSKSRRILRTGLNRTCGRPKYYSRNPLEKNIKMVENSIHPDNVDRYESIPFNVVYSSTALPQLESQSKVPVYANFEDVQELSV